MAPQSTTPSDHPQGQPAPNMAATEASSGQPSLPSSTTGESAEDEKKDTCSFVNKLCPETRILIYQHIFGPGEYSKAVDNAADGSTGDRIASSEEDTKLHISIFATNKLLREESLETFYDIKTIRLTFPQLEQGLEHKDHDDMVRKLEITDCNEDYAPPLVQEVLAKAQILPRIKSVIILRDPQAVTGPPEDHITVRDWAQKFQLGELVCMDVGQYKLDGKFHKVRFVHDKLRKMWPSVVDIPEDYDALAELVKEVNDTAAAGELFVTATVWACHTSFRMFVGMADLYRATLRGEMQELLSPASNGGIPIDMMSAMCLTSWWRSIQVLNFDDTLGPEPTLHLRQLRLHHSALALECASEFLSRIFRPTRDRKARTLKLKRSARHPCG